MTHAAITIARANLIVGAMVTARDGGNADFAGAKIRPVAIPTGKIAANIAAPTA
ncbi:MAG: hypothetical protein WCC11_11090 [Gammaproteobacteria bacterium]